MNQVSDVLSPRKCAGTTPVPPGESDQTSAEW
jgi:hypothetical protein